MCPYAEGPAGRWSRHRHPSQSRCLRHHTPQRILALPAVGSIVGIYTIYSVVVLYAHYAYYALCTITHQSRVPSRSDTSYCYCHYAYIPTIIYIYVYLQHGRRLWFKILYNTVQYGGCYTRLHGNGVVRN